MTDCQCAAPSAPRADTVSGTAASEGCRDIFVAALAVSLGMSHVQDNYNSGGVQNQGK